MTHYHHPIHGRMTILEAVDDAIASSVQRDEVIRMYPEAGAPYVALTHELSARSDDSGESDEIEYWGTDEDGNDWRVHVSIV